ncbi:MAG: sialidase family protein [Pyrinomonadaceae bacterium]
MNIFSFVGASLLAVAVGFSISCRKESSAPSVSLSMARELATPAAAQSGEPELFVAADGQIILSWVEKINDHHHALRFATRKDDGWSEPLTVAEGDNWFVNWADFPSVVKLSDNSLAAHWLVKSASAKYAYDVRVARSTDGGRTWTRPFTPHRDNTPTEHGFVSLVPYAEGGALAAVWLDGRKFGADEHARTGEAHIISALHADGKSHAAAAAAGKKTNEMTLRYATLNADGTLADEAELDGRVCDCCQTAAAATADGLVVVYRDRSEKEVRDFSVVRRLANGEWIAPRTLYTDDWQISACPVSGASVAVNHATASRDTPQVKVSFSADSGATFGQPVRVDNGAAHGRVDVVLLDDGSALVSWLEGTTQSGKIKARRVRHDGAPGDVITIAETSVNRSSGFPRMARSRGSEVVFAWTEAGPIPRVRTAVANFADTEAER